MLHHAGSALAVALDVEQWQSGGGRRETTDPATQLGRQGWRAVNLRPGDRLESRLAGARQGQRPQRPPRRSRPRAGRLRRRRGGGAVTATKAAPSRPRRPPPPRVAAGSGSRAGCRRVTPGDRAGRRRDGHDLDGDVVVAGLHHPVGPLPRPLFLLALLVGRLGVALRLARVPVPIVVFLQTVGGLLAAQALITGLRPAQPHRARRPRASGSAPASTPPRRTPPRCPRRPPASSRC